MSIYKYIEELVKEKDNDLSPFGLKLKSLGIRFKDKEYEMTDKDFELLDHSYTTSAYKPTNKIIQ